MYVSLTKITIVLCWLSLFSFWAIKLFGGNWFEIMVKNENFVKFSDTVQNTWLKYLVSLIATTLSNYLMLGAVLQTIKFKGKRCVTLVLSIFISWSVSNFVNVVILKMFAGYIVAIIAAIIFNAGKKKLYGILCIGLDFVFSTISMVTRGVELSLITDYLVLLIGSIDLYIMYCLYFLYSNSLKIKKEH